MCRYILCEGSGQTLSGWSHSKSWPMYNRPGAPHNRSGVLYNWSGVLHNGSGTLHVHQAGVTNVSLSPLALTHCSSGRHYSDTADKVTSALFNIRSISTHFVPKIDAYKTANNITSLTPDQVSAYCLETSTRACF